VEGGEAEDREDMVFNIEVFEDDHLFDIAVHHLLELK
jgi:hypothetical protein